MATEVEPLAKPPAPAWRRLLVAAGWFALITVAVSAGVYLFNRNRLMSQLDRVTKELDETDPGWRYRDVFTNFKEIPAEEDSVPRIREILKSVPRGWPDYKQMEKFQD